MAEGTGQRAQDRGHRTEGTGQRAFRPLADDLLDHSAVLSQRVPALFVSCLGHTSPHFAKTPCFQSAPATGEKRSTGLSGRGRFKLISVGIKVSVSIDSAISSRSTLLAIA